MATCPGCGGTRTYTTTVPNVRKYGGVEYVSSIQPTKTLVFPCAVCGGSGRVDCEACGDTGYVEEGTTEPEGLYPCDCAAGQREMAAETVTTRAGGR